MTTAVNPPNKANEDVSALGQVHGDGAGHHMKSVAKKCNLCILLPCRLSSDFFCLFYFKGIESKMTGKNTSRFILN